MKQIQFRNGNLYLDHDLYETYFNSIQSVAILRKDNKFLLTPLQQSGGGLLLKILNAKGDRVVHANEYFQNYGIDLSKERCLDVEWDQSYAALSFEIGDV